MKSDIISCKHIKFKYNQNDMIVGCKGMHGDNKAIEIVEPWSHSNNQQHRGQNHCYT